MQLNENQIKYLRGSIKLLERDPIAEMTEFWLEWANANIENAQHADGKFADVVWIKAECVIPVVWILSNLYDCEPIVVFNLMKRQLRGRAAFIGSKEPVELDFEEANHLLGRVISGLVPQPDNSVTTH